jgi:hypothetical protein
MTADEVTTDKAQLNIQQSTNVLAQQQQQQQQQLLLL